VKPSLSIFGNKLLRHHAGQRLSCRRGCGGSSLPQQGTGGHGWGRSWHCPRPPSPTPGQSSEGSHSLALSATSPSPSPLASGTSPAFPRARQELVPASRGSGRFEGAKALLEGPGKPFHPSLSRHSANSTQEPLAAGVFAGCANRTGWVRAPGAAAPWVTGLGAGHGLGWHLAVPPSRGVLARVCGQHRARVAGVGTAPREPGWRLARLRHVTRGSSRGPRALWIPTDSSAGL